MLQRSNYELRINQTKRKAAGIKAWICSKECKNLASFWMLGIGIDFGYWAIITAAHDLVSQGEDTVNNFSNATTRECNQLSTGIVLVINIFPNLMMKLLLPFLPLWIHARTFVAIVTSVFGFALAAYKQTRTYILIGVAITSLSVGIGESTYLMYIPYFKDKKIVSAWASGTGASGFLASLTYLALISGGVSLSTTLYLMILAPLALGLVFWLLLDHPKTEIDSPVIPLDHPKENRHEPNVPDHVTTADKTNIIEKFKILYRYLFSYSLPFFLEFFLEYLINQGLFELIHNKNNFMDLASDVRWFNFIFLASISISRSLGHLKVNYLWLMVFLQAANLVIFISESVYGWMGIYSFWIVVVLIIWEGVVSGLLYVNTYRRMNADIPVDHRQFAMSINSVGASLGILIAGLIAVPLHNFICALPPP